MGVGASEPEGTDPGHGVRIIRPARCRANDVDRQVGKGDFGVGSGEIQRRRDAAPVQDKRCLDQARDPGRGLEMADIGLDRPHGAAVIRRIFEHTRQRKNFDRVAQWRSRAMRLDIGQLIRARAAAPQCGFHDGGLTRPARRGQPVGAPVLICRGAEDAGVNAVAVRCRILRTAQDHRAGPLAAHIAIGPGVEGLAHAIRRQHARGRERHHQLRRQD